MTEAEWDTSDDPLAMLALLGRRAGDRKLRLFAWFGVFMAGSLALWTMVHMDKIDFLAHALAMAPKAAADAAVEYPLVFFPAVGIVIGTMIQVFRYSGVQVFRTDKDNPS